MYVWIWRRLPGRQGIRVLQVLMLLAIAAALLFIVVFPRVEPLLPYSDVTVDPGPKVTSSPG
jgi:hypothetical protein